MRRNLSVTIQLNTPCHEDWEKMDELEKGRFCKACNKEVIDFTGYSDKALRNFFLKHPILVCGRFTKEQTGTALYFNEPGRKKPDLVAALAASVLTFYTISANAAPAPLFNTPLVNAVSHHEHGALSQNDSTIINGSITDVMGTPLQQATISFGGKKYTTDEEGKFHIVLSSSEAVKGVFIFSYGGFVNEVRNYNPVMESTNFSIRLRKEAQPISIIIGIPSITFHFPELTTSRLFKKDRISDDAIIVLAELANTLRNHPATVININTQYLQSKKEALEKAKKLKQYLVEKEGISEERLLIKEPKKVSTKKEADMISFTANNE